MLWIRLGLAITLKWGLRFTELAGIYFIPDPYRIIFPDIHKLFAQEKLLEKYRTLLKKNNNNKTHKHTNKNSSRWPIYVINSVENTKLLSFTLLATQHHSFFRNLPSWYPKHWNSETGKRKRKDDECGRQTIEEQTNKPSNEQGHLLHNFKCFWTGIEYLIEYF